MIQARTSPSLELQCIEPFFWFYVKLQHFDPPSFGALQMVFYKYNSLQENPISWQPKKIGNISFAYNWNLFLCVCTLHQKKKKSFILRSQFWVPGLFFFSCYSSPIFPASSIKYTLKIRTKIQLAPCYKLFPWEWNDKDRVTSKELSFFFLPFFLSEEHQWSLWTGGVAQFASVLPFPSVLL